jgi:hypothetical protein
MVPPEDDSRRRAARRSRVHRLDHVGVALGDAAPAHLHRRRDLAVVVVEFLGLSARV